MKLYFLQWKRLVEEVKKGFLVEGKMRRKGKMEENVRQLEPR